MQINVTLGEQDLGKGKKVDSNVDFIGGREDKSREKEESKRLRQRGKGIGKTRGILKHVFDGRKGEEEEEKKRGRGGIRGY